MYKGDRRFLGVFSFIIATFLVVSCQKDDDESRPYEFGFTIDGQQHRHEKKDVNGIIQGEFGFITADGIYHVTVYATDENGNFRILSMKNIRISAPLDGSPLPQGQKISDYKQSGNPVKANQVQLPNPSLAPVQVRPIQTTTYRPKAPFTFTTQPTIKPACGGCGYVTTAKPKPGQPFPFQTPAFQTPNQQNSGTYPNTGQNQGSTNANFPGQSRPNYFGQNGPNYPGQSGPNYPGQSEPNYPSQSGSNYLKPGSGSASPQQGFANPGPNEIVNVNNQANPRPHKPLREVTVSNGAIHVPGNADIPIRDKYPGMVDGLPNGIKEKDITDLLYKFNYTVGFHGHYEKGLKNGAKVGGYFVTGRDGVSRVVTYVADENGFRPKVKFIRLDLNSDEVPKEGTEKTFGLKNFEFVWYPVS
ncbi:Chitin bind 4, PAT1, DUF1421 and/or Glutenin hmw domain containing protein [Asbolus verrucosus]|uniref:Chitin bind 4, PAT1, DUF1421 and/or Glutenin hmw domain containing protein n=1 Tax=Asbolus verrucosus TaxID=1661398 RepID=A0A482VPH0_ASBVE|nr:Chitin bind 4, PAT1, DUF1421 and/or Glutenin hmw domain containing protein [Asbolus verrucosus]